MDAKFSKICSICKQELASQSIPFSCGHIYCYNCFPYLLFPIIRNCESLKTLLESKNGHFTCNICNYGKASLPFDDLLEFFCQKKKESLKTPNILCAACEEKHFAVFCLGCNKNFCNECLEIVHRSFKKYSTHETISIDKKNQLLHELKLQRLCACPAEKPLEEFCIKCNSSICSYCCKVYHEKHHHIPVEDVLGNKTYADVKKDVKELKESFANFKENVMKSYDEEIQSQNKLLNQMMYEVSDMLNKLKEKNLEKSKREREILGKNLELIEECLGFFETSLNQNNTLHPNEFYQMDKIFAKDRKPIPTLVGEYIENIKKLVGIKTNIEQFYGKYVDDEERIVRYGCEEHRLDFKYYNNFKSSPLALLAKPETVLKRKNLNLDHEESNISCCFAFQSESFLAWAGYSNEKGKEYYPIYIYNLSSMKKEITLQSDSVNPITALSTYPKEYSEYDYKKWLYVGDNSGKLRIYNLDPEHAFDEIHNFMTGKEPIYSIMFFQDKFNELSEIENDRFRDVCILISFRGEKGKQQSNLGLLKLSKNKIQSIKNISNPVKKECYCINYFHDEVNFKTRVFFGFSHGFVKSYDLKTNSWDTQQFEAKGFVGSLNFVLKRSVCQGEEIIENLILFSNEENSLALANVDTGVILKTLKLNDDAVFGDICLWNVGEEIEKQFILVSTRDYYSIKVLNLDLKVIKTFLVDEEDSDFDLPVNLMKAFKIDESANKIKECLIGLIGDKESSRVILYE